jgi:chemotaxis protein MotD
MVLLGNATTAAETAAQAVAAATASGKTQQMTAGAEATADAEPDLKLSQKILALAADGDATVDDATTAAPGTTDPAIDTVFRLSRADGKGGTLDMVIADKKAGLDDTAAASTNAKVENISVLDARRFLAVAGQDNSSAVTQAISQDKDWSSALSSRSLTDDSSTSQATGKVVNTLKIQMHPLDLGQVTATMHLRNDELTVSLRVQTGEAYRQLNQDQDKMIDALRSQGYAVDQITVQLVSTNQQDTQSQNSGQQSRGETGSFQNQGREQQDNNARRQAASGAWQSDDTSSSANGTGTADPSRSGDVYI